MFCWTKPLIKIFIAFTNTYNYNDKEYPWIKSHVCYYEQIISSEKFTSKIQKGYLDTLRDLHYNFCNISQNFSYKKEIQVYNRNICRSNFRLFLEISTLEINRYLHKSILTNNTIQVKCAYCFAMFCTENTFDKCFQSEGIIVHHSPVCHQREKNCGCKTVDKRARITPAEGSTAGAKLQ